MGFIPLAVLASGSKYIRGEQVFTTSGTFTVPEDVYSISVVCVGGGGGGNKLDAIMGRQSGAGACGGGLGWKNNIAVTPGQTFTVVVGAGGIGEELQFGAGSGGGDSYFIDDTTVAGKGGPAFSDTSGGGFVGDGGGTGGSSGISQDNPSTTNTAGGGGGAGGYSGNGGKGGDGQNQDGENGLGGAAGGGGGGGGSATGGNGGGVGLLGEGASGTGGNGTSSDGENGQPGSGGVGKLYGGGGAGTSTTGGTQDGGNGAVRIIWGKGEVYPTPRNRML